MKIGILGAGQLGQMLGEAAATLGHSCVFIDPAADACARSVGEVRVGSFTDLDFVQDAFRNVDVVTYEFENIPVKTVQMLEVHHRVHPSSAVLQVTQDRVEEKTLAMRLGISPPAFRAVHAEDDLIQAMRDLGLPLVLKTRRMGYDGKGQVTLRTSDDAVLGRELLQQGALIAEAFIPFDFECSFIACRSASGEIRHLPPTRNVHRSGILHTTVTPSDIDPSVIRTAQTQMEKVLTHFQYVGVFTMECFVRGSELLFNEWAPRVHNSGHWSIEGASVSQFALHIRAISGMDTPVCESHNHWGMMNLVGSIPDLSSLQSDPDTCVHLYGKEPKPGRKLGHVTVVALTGIALSARMSALEKMISPRE